MIETPEEKKAEDLEESSAPAPAEESPKSEEAPAGEAKEGEEAPGEEKAEE